MNGAFELGWIKAGAVAGVAAGASYGYLVFGVGPARVGVAVAAAFSISLSLASFGL